MRLIDADALKKIIDEKEKWILELIDEQPTAYDMEKVVADIEQLKVETKKNNYKTDFALDVAIAMVKGEI